MSDSFVYVGPLISCLSDGDTDIFEVHYSQLKSDARKKLLCYPAGWDVDPYRYHCWRPNVGACPYMKSEMFGISQFHSQIEEDILELPEFDRKIVIKWMETEFGSVISELKQIYGEDNVLIKVGIFIGQS